MYPLHTADYAVLGLYLVAVIVICVRVTRRSPDSEDLFLAGRSLGVGVVGLSLFASNISSTTMIGLPGAAWQSGISVANYEWWAALVLIFTAIFVLPVLIGSKITTIPELLERRYDSRLRKYLSAVSVFLSIVLDTAGSLYAGALVLMLFVPGLELWPTCIGIAVFAGLYTAAGGLRAVALTDVLQAVVLLVGSLWLTLLVFAEFDYSWSNVTAAVPADNLSLIRPWDDPVLPWPGTLIGLPILGFYYWTMNQYVSQRLLGARDVATAGWGSMLAAVLKLLPLFLMVLPGVMAAALFTDLERADTVFPRLVAEYAPIGVAGMLIAGLLAAIMSSIDSALNSASTLITLDFVSPKRPDLGTSDLARMGRYITLTLVALAAMWAPMIDSFPGLFAYLQQGFAYVTPPLVAVFLLGVFHRGIGATAAFRACATGHAVSVVWFVATQLGWLNIHFTVVAGILLAVTGIATFAWQAMLGETPTATQLGTVEPSNYDPMPAAVKRAAVVLTLAVAVLVVAFW